GPPGFGIAPLPAASDLFSPPYPGPQGAFETYTHIIASPAAVGLTIADAANGTGHLGEREAIALAMIRGGVVLNEADLAGTVNSAGQQVKALGELPALAVPNPVSSGFNAGKVLDVAAIDVVGHIGVNADGSSQKDYYSFQGLAGDLITLDVMSSALTRYAGHYFDAYVRVFGPDGSLVASNDDQFEPSDALLLDLRLPQNGTYTVEVSQVIDPVKHAKLGADSPEAGVANPDGIYELFIYRFGAHNPTTGNDTFSGRGGHNTLSGGTDGINTVVESGDVNFTLTDASLTFGSNSDTLAGIKKANLTGGASANSFTV